MFFQAIRALEDYHLQNDEEEKRQQSWLKTLYQNVALCLLRVSHSHAARMFADKALYIDPNSEKAHYIVGKVMKIHCYNLSLFCASLRKPKASIHTLCSVLKSKQYITPATVYPCLDACDRRWVNFGIGMLFYWSYHWTQFPN